ncbi:MAG: hypothetical protein BWK80_33115 [Desulfobacteraceae bacterium IS3]|nr:MAG: hypothetical protein BWK80_33115 [Desulfobacteraceae bacterium IS3]
MKKQTDRHFFCTSPVAGILLASLCLLIASPLFAAAIAADIRGHVIFEDTAAVASYATVQVSYSGTTQTVGAVTDGNFSIPMATDMTGTVSLIAEPPTGYETTYSNSKSLKIEITDTSTSLILPEPLKLRRLGKITGQVRKDSVTGTVVQNANIIAESG